MTDDLHQDDYSIISDALEKFDEWIRSEFGVEPTRGHFGEWHDSSFKGTPTKERRYGHNAGIKATFMYDNRSRRSGLLCPNGFVKVHGVDGSTRWRYRDSDDWRRQAEAVKPLTPEELAAIKEREQREREKAEREAAATAAENAAIWKADLDAYLNDADRITPSSAGIGVDYLTRKRVAADVSLRLMRHDRRVIFRDGAKQFFPAGSLIIPLFDVLTGQAIAFQWITKPTGKDNKFFRRGRPLDKIVHWIGDPCGREIVALAEGYATAWTFHDLTGIPTGSTCDAGQLKKTATALLKSDAFTGGLVIAADDDFIKAIEAGKWNTGDRIAKEIKALAPDRVFIIQPPFDHHAIIHSSAIDDKPSDWNDFFIAYGEAARPIAAALRDEAIRFFRDKGDK